MNGKRRIQTFFVILKCMLCIFFVSFLQKRLFFKNRLNQTKKTNFGLSATLGPLWGCFWPLSGLSWLLLGRFWVAFGRSWPLLAALGPLLGPSWPLLGGSWAALGRSWAALGRSWAALGPLLERHVNIIEKSMRKRPHVGSQKGAKMEPKSTPKRSKIDDKNRCEKRMDIRPS